MCIYNFTNSIKFNKIIHQYNLQINHHSVIGCLVKSNSISHIMPIKNNYSFVVIHKDQAELGFCVLMSTNRLTNGIIHEMLDSFEEYLVQIT